MATDNSALGKKVALRMEMLERYHAKTPTDVLDCCQGQGVMWRILRSRFGVDSYWGVDLKPQPGRLKIDSTRLLRGGPRRENVVDIDTYGAPWSHWQALLESGIDKPTTVFLTNGQGIGMLGGSTKLMTAWLGLERLQHRAPTLAKKAEVRFGIHAALSQAEQYGIRVIECIEDASKTAAYYGIRLEAVQ
jgi:hypothetical protein